MEYKLTEHVQFDGYKAIDEGNLFKMIDDRLKRLYRNIIRKHLFRESKFIVTIRFNFKLIELSDNFIKTITHKSMMEKNIKLIDLIRNKDESYDYTINANIVKYNDEPLNNILSEEQEEDITDYLDNSHTCIVHEGYNKKVHYYKILDMVDLFVSKEVK